MTTMQTEVISSQPLLSFLLDNLIGALERKQLQEPEILAPEVKKVKKVLEPAEMQVCQHAEYLSG